MRKNFIKTTILILSAAVLFPAVSSAGFLKPKRGGSSSSGASSSNSSSTGGSSAPAERTLPDSAKPVASSGTVVDTKVAPGTYDVVTLGTAGGHRSQPGGTGVLTISSSGTISGSIFHYDDGSTDTLSGSINLDTGKGTVTTGNETYSISGKTTTKSYSYLEATYSKNGSDSKGKLWGIR